MRSIFSYEFVLLRTCAFSCGGGGGEVHPTQAMGGLGALLVSTSHILIYCLILVVIVVLVLNHVQ